MTIERLDIGPRMSQAAIVGNLVFTAGRVAERNAGRDVGSQTREILEALDALLARAGTDKSRIVSVNIWLAAIGDFDAMNAVYDAWVDKVNPPVRACVEARLAGSEFAVEIAVIAER
ncbi:MAG TPA: RidA family protein [Paracoccaceae bacterium]|nr:RidA family protein [Paracoccaceae bacterium]